MIDFDPAATAMSDLATAISDDRLTAPTPCADTTVGDLLDHVLGLSLAFAAAARKDFGPLTEQAPGDSSAANLEPGWRDQLPVRLADLATAWADPAAWEGETQAGGVTMPADQMAAVALNELVVHAWDLARSTGQDYTVDHASVHASYGFTSAAAAHAPEGTPGLFGPPVPISESAPLLHRTIAMSGRDPAWTP